MARGVDDHLVRAVSGLRAEEPDLGGAARVGHGIRLARKTAVLGAALGAAEDRVEVGNRAHAPAGRVGIAAGGAVGPDLGRRAILASLAEGALLRRVRVRD